MIKAALRSLFGLAGPEVEAKATGSASGAAPTSGQDLAPVAIKTRPGGSSIPSYQKEANPDRAQALKSGAATFHNASLTNIRASTTQEAVRKFIERSPDLGAAVSSYVRMGITSSHTAVATNQDGTVNPEATRAAVFFLNWLNTPNDIKGFDSTQGLRSLCETWGRELFFEGAICAELILDKARMPDFIQPLSASQIQLFPDGRRIVPKQKVGSDLISLDIATFFMVQLDQDTLDPYPKSPISQAVLGVLFNEEFIDDIRKVVRRAIHPRTIVSIDEEKFMKYMPDEYRHDAAKCLKYRDETVRALEEQINGLRPEETLVVFDTIGVDVVDHGYTNLSQEYEVIRGMADARMIAGAKVMPTVLGQGNGTANTASAETLMFLKYVEATVWAKLNDLLSRILTVVVRLYGHPATVEFKLGRIELRPESELEAFKAMEQSRILDLLSLGLVTDEDASIRLTGRLPPAGYVNKSGTGFRSTASSTPTGDGYNGATNSGSTLNQKIKSDAPQGQKGPQK